MKRSILSIGLSILFTVGITAPANSVEAQYLYYAKENTRGFAVGKSVALWNRNPVGIKLVEVDSCDDYIHCVTVRGVDVSHFRDSGGVFTSWSDGSKSIDLFNWRGFTYNERRMVSCHEFGHFLGIDHNRYGCMRSWIRPDYFTIDPRIYPTWRNLNNVEFPS